MKKTRIFVILLSVTAALLAGCTRLDEPVGGNEAASGDDGRVTFDVALTIPTDENPATKAMADDPDIRNIYVVVFGSNNYLNEFVKAMPLKASNEPNLNADGSYKYEKVGGVYKVRFSLEQTTSQRHVHVLANVPEGSVPPEFGYVDDVLGKNIYSSEGADGYWQYLSFPSGIDNNAKDAFDGLKLVRNFAKVSLVADAGSGFTVLGFDLYNVPSRGSFAPFKGLLSERTFQTEWDNGGSGLAKDYAALLGEYPGYLMYGSTLNSPSYVEGDFPTDEEAKKAKYCYEHPASEENPTYIIAKLEKGGDGGKFYRLDLVDNAGKKSAIIRNYHYTVTIQSIDTDGHGTIEGAEGDPSDYNFTLKADNQNIPEISNYGAYMETSYVEKVFTTAQSGVEFKYRYDENISTSSLSDYKPGVVSAINGDGEVTWEPGFDGVGTPNSDGWYTLKYDVADPSTANNSEVLSTFTVTAGEGNKMIRRVVNIISMKQKELQVNTWSHDPLNNRLTLSFTLPDGLRRSMFPLQFKFQADDFINEGRQILSPQDGDMVTGYEITSSGSVIYFLKDYYYNTYESGSKTITINFEAPESVTPVMYLTDRDNYFVPLKLGKVFATGLSANAIANGTGHETTFEFVTTSTSPITLGLADLTAVSSSTGTLDGNKYTPNQAGTQRIVLAATTRSDPGTVTLSMSGYDSPDPLTIPRYSTYVSGPVTLADKLPLGTGKETTFSFNYTARDLMEVKISAPNVEIYANGIWNDGSCTFTPVAQGVQTFTIRSKTNFKDAGSISLSVTDMTNPASVAITRPTSFIVPKNALALSGTDNFTLPVYWRADHRSSTSGVAGSSSYFSNTTNTGNIAIDISSLGDEDSTPVYFLYTYTYRVFVFIPVTGYKFAQTTLGALINATAGSPVPLNFN